MWQTQVGLAAFYLGDDDRAADWLRRSIETNRNYPISHFALAAVLATVGRLEEARAAVQTGLSLDPKFTIARFREMGSAMASIKNPSLSARRKSFYDGLHMAGLSVQ